MTQDNNLWHGYEIQDSILNGRNFKIVFPEEANENRDWIWRARFWGHEPQCDLALLDLGFHLTYIDVAGLWGNETAINTWDVFYKHIIERYRLNPKVVLEGMSRGGLIVYNWSNRNAEKVACIYCDAPLCDISRWLDGTNGQDLSMPENPVDNLENIAEMKVPILHVVGDADSVVPVSKHTEVMRARLLELGLEMEVIHKPGVGHHPHSLPDPKPIVDFILTNTGHNTDY
jgi:pimeloyl-ACP methyl ester carboxylesterase